MNEYQPDLKPEKKSGKFRYVLGGLLLAFVGGALLAVWGAQRYDLLGTNQAAPPPVIAADDGFPKPAFDTLPVGSGTPAPMAAGEDPVATRVDDLESRLSRINAQAEAASGNANRAEGMLIAFAARRAIDSGAALGYIENQLITRFGTSQGPAVTMIVKASQDPVTLDILRAELASQGDAWTSQAGISTWGKVQREMSELFVLRRDTTPSPAPTRRLERARQYTEVGNIEAAMREVANLPGKAQARNWLDKAARYVAVRRALDSIERSALAQPAALNTPPVPNAAQTDPQLTLPVPAPTTDETP
jgi:hypothetical protein